MEDMDGNYYVAHFLEEGSNWINVKCLKCQSKQEAEDLKKGLEEGKDFAQVHI